MNDLTGEEFLATLEAEGDCQFDPSWDFELRAAYKLGVMDMASAVRTRLAALKAVSA